ncbi:hypothetical protein V1478_004776 [Vespula squamosa]|uniref:Uncharacterized protein n=1 Tax=Vespula squamosa TaxID=30214 RepID=A0ABD2BER7_VESSQ
MMGKHLSSLLTKIYKNIFLYLHVMSARWRPFARNYFLAFDNLRISSITFEYHMYFVEKDERTYRLNTYLANERSNDKSDTIPLDIFISIMRKKNN